MENWIYLGQRNPDGAARVRIFRNGQEVGRLDPRYDLRNHSPTGFEWGYCGSGPAQLALALCAHALEDDARAAEVYQAVKAEWIAAWEGPEWQTTAVELRELVRQIEERPGRREPVPENPTPGTEIPTALAVVVEEAPHATGTSVQSAEAASTAGKRRGRKGSGDPQEEGGGR